MSFTLRYSIKELKKRPREFLPILLASLGVMILVFNLIIYLESRRITDISYYKLDFEYKLYEMTEKDILELEPLPYIKNIHKMNDGKGTYTLYIGFTSPAEYDYHAILRTAERLMNEQNIWRRPFYEGYRPIYDEQGVNFFRDFDNWFNTQYVNALLAQSFLSPEMLVTMIAASLLMGATMTLVFNLKLKKNISEYASLRSMGMTALNILKINMLQGIGIMTLCIPFTAALSAVVMKAVCSASHNLYPEIKDNTPLTYVLPTGYIIASFLIMAAVSGAAILLLCRRYNQKSIVELTRGAVLLKISFVEKSSDKFEKSGDFAFYGRLHDKRTRRTRASVTALSVCLLVLPVMFTYIVVYLISDVASRAFTRDANAYAIYTLTTARRSNNYIPKSVIDEIEALDGVIKVGHTPLSASSIKELYIGGDSYFTPTITSSDNRKYDATNIMEYDDFHMNYIDTVVLSGNVDDLSKDGMIAVYEESGFSAGDKVTIRYGKYKCEAMVAAVLKITSKTEFYYGGQYYSTAYPIYCGLYTLVDLMEIPRDDIRFTGQVGIFGEVGREDELIELIEEIAGVEDQFKSVYEQRMYQTDIAGENIYLTIKKDDTVTLFMALFIAAQILFLYVSGGLIISSVTDFNINTRRREFAVIRSLGGERENVIELVRRSAVTSAIVCAAAAVIIGTGLAIGIADNLLFEGGILIVLKRIGGYIAKGVLSYIFVFAYSILLHLIVSIRSAKRITGDSLIKDIREI